MDSRRWRRATVLAVDDQHANLVAVDAVLSSDFDVVRAHSGEEALSILSARSDIDVVLMDVQMPRMDGFEAAARVKEVPGYQDIPIVFLTAVYHEDPFVKQGYQVGAVDYFSKPFDPEILRIKLRIYASFRQKSDLLKEWERLIEGSRELLRAGRQFSSMLEHQHLHVVVMDREGRVSSMNTEPLPATLDWWDSAGALREGRSTSIARVIAKGETSQEHVEVRGASGEPRSLLCTASALHEPGGEVSGVVLIVRDVTERNLLELDLERRIAGLISAGAEVGAW